MKVPTDRKYASTHEWFLIEGDTVTVGISQYAADELTDITFVELPEVGGDVGADEPCGGIESVKAYSELYCSVKGRVIEINQALDDNPGLVNKDAFGEGWLLKIKTDDAEGLGGLMDARAYQKHIAAG